MDNATAVGIKFAVVALLTAFVLPGASRVAYERSLLIAAVFVAVSYPAVDLGVLPIAGGVAAMLADLAIAALLFRYAPPLLTGESVGWDQVLAASAWIAVAEMVVHTYVKRTVLPRR